MSFNQTRILIFGFKRFLPQTQLSIISLPAVCTVCNDCCDLLVCDGNRCVTAELQPRAIWHVRESETVVINYSACEWVSTCPILHSTPRRGSFLSQFRVEVYNTLAMMRNRKLATQILPSQACNSQLSLARHC